MSVALGVDIGGTKIAAGVVDEAGAVLDRWTVATPSLEPERIDQAVAELYRLAGSWNVDRIGIAAAGLVSSDRQTVMFAPNISWRSYPLAARVRALIDEDVPVVVENDANAAGWAEYRFGAGSQRDMVMLTIGTGVGGAVISGGRLQRGASGAGAEVGHLKLFDGGLRCGCGQLGCLEAYASGTALERSARQAAEVDPVSAERLIDLAGRADVIRGVHLGIAATEGDPLALSLIDGLGEWIGKGAASMAAILDPAIVVIGGGVGDLGDLLLPSVERSLNAHLTGQANRPRIGVAPALLANQAGIVGAADLARSCDFHDFGAVGASVKGHAHVL